MALNNIAPWNTQAALACVNICANLDRPQLVQSQPRLNEVLIGPQEHGRIFSETDFPCTWGFSANSDWLLVFISGIRSISHFPALVRSYLDAQNRPASSAYLHQVSVWSNYLRLRLRNDSVWIRPNTYVIGHSLGGAIATTLISSLADEVHPGSIRACTFGQPKVIGLDYTPKSGVSFARWTNPLDNVSSLPAGPEQAPLIYAALTHDQRRMLQAWKHPCQATSISATGAISTIDDPPSIPVTTTTLLSLMQARLGGVFGEGHLLPTYKQNLEIAIAATQTTTTPPVLVSLPQAPQARPTPLVITPRSPPPVIDNASLDRRFVAFREEATNADARPTNIPNPFKMRAFRNNSTWYIAWMDYTIAVGPSRKKAQALARHMNRFLRIYQGVGESYSQAFVFALIDYLSYAADSDSGITPLLNDGGNPPQFFPA